MRIPVILRSNLIYRDTKNTIDYGNINGINPVYTTFKGGCDSWNDDMSYWSYTFLCTVI